MKLICKSLFVGEVQAPIPRLMHAATGRTLRKRPKADGVPAAAVKKSNALCPIGAVPALTVATATAAGVGTTAGEGEANGPAVQSDES